jgi:hypothetical protein
MAMDSANTGEKSKFDYTVLMGLIRQHDVGAAIDDFLGDLTLALDRWGRILFLLYTHKDAFSEQYGEENLPYLQSAIENIFKETGEVLIKLEQEIVKTDNHEQMDLAKA